MKIINLKETLKPLYAAKKGAPCLLRVPALPCLMVDGTGDPNSPAFQEAVGALYAVAYTMKFAFKKEKGIDYPVTALEALWDAVDIGAYAAGKRDEWQWTALVVLPDVVTKKDVVAAVAAARVKGKLPPAPEVRFGKLAEGLCAQVLHVGPYAAEAPTIAALHEFIRSQGYAPTGKHHEVYLGDPRRSAPEKLKTIIRQPVKKA